VTPVASAAAGTSGGQRLAPKGSKQDR